MRYAFVLNLIRVPRTHRHLRIIRIITMNPIFTPIISGVLVMLGGVFLKAYIDIKLKFATTEDQNIQVFIRIALFCLISISQSGLIVLLVVEFSSSEPLTRLSLLTILLSAFGLSHTFIHLYYHRSYMPLFEIMTSRLLEVLTKTHENK